MEIKRVFKWFLLTLTFLAVLPHIANAQSRKTVFISPNGFGSQSGTSAGNAAPLSKAHSLMWANRELRMIFLNGTYILERPLVVGGTAGDHRTMIEGKGTVVLKSNYKPTEGGYGFSAFEISKSNVTIRNINFESIGNCVRALNSRPSDDIIIERINAKNTSVCVLVHSGQESKVTNWIVRNANIKSYAKAGIRFGGENTSDILIENVTLDGSLNEARVDCYIDGIQIFNGAHNISIKGTEISNHVGQCESGSIQASGIRIDGQKTAPKSIEISDTVVSNSSFSGMNLSGEAVSLKNVSLKSGPTQQWGLRVANADDFSCQDCVIESGIEAALYGSDAKLNLSGQSRIEIKADHAFCNVADNKTFSIDLSSSTAIVSETDGKPVCKGDGSFSLQEADLVTE